MNTSSNVFSSAGGIVAIDKPDLDTETLIEHAEVDTGFDLLAEHLGDLRQRAIVDGLAVGDDQHALAQRFQVAGIVGGEQHGSAIAQAAHILSAAASHKAPFEKSPGPKPRRCLAFEAA